MALSIKTNIASMAAVQRMDTTMAKLGKTFERLTSGIRVNSSADDSSAFSMSERMTTKIRGMNVAINNSSDGISLLQVADAALDETTNSLQRMRDLMLTAGNPTLTESDRDVIQSDVEGLVSEVQRIADNTQFNGMLLLSGGYAAKLFQIGASNGQNLSITITGAGTATLGVTTEDVGVADAAAAMEAASANLIVIDTALTSVATLRAGIGTLQNRFESVITGLNSMVASTELSRSRLIDADIATETANLTRLSIMQQAGASVLAQANQQPSVMLQLLRG